MKRSVRIALIAVLAVVFVAAGLHLGISGVQAWQAQQEYNEAGELAGLNQPTPEVTPQPTIELTPEPTPEPTPVPTAEPTPVPTPEPTPEPTQPPAANPNAEMLASIDLAALRAQNPDVVGWIAIPGTQLSYPLMQGEDNDYYLNHTWKKVASGVGSIYLDYRNNADMLDFNSIIYGHRMNDGSMFNSLRHYSDQSYWEEHPSIYIVTDSGIHRYDIFTAYEADVVNGHTYRLGLKEADGQQAYINYCSRRSVIETGVTPEPGDCIITLSTCVSMGAEYDTRWVVQAVRKMNP